MRQKLFIVLFVTVITGAGCSITKTPQDIPQTPDVAYRETVQTDTAALTKWTEFFRDTVLQKLISAALYNNKDILSAAARIEQAAAEAAITRAALYPSAGYQARAGGGRAGTEVRKVAGGTNGGVFNGYAVLNWELDLWGKLRAGKRSAIANYRSLVAAKNYLTISLIAETASQYFLLRDLDNRLLIARQTLAGRKSYTLIITERFDKGYIAELDKLMAIQQEADVAAGIPSLERLIVQTENSIRLLMGQAPGLLERGAFNNIQQVTFDIPVGLPSQLLQRRPDIVSAEQTLQAQAERVGIARANRFPSLTLTGVLGFASPQLNTLLNSSGLVANGMAGLAGPIFNFDQLKNQVKVEREKTRQAMYQYEQTVLAAFRDVDNSLTYTRTYGEEYAQRKIQADASAKALLLSTARYDHGFTSFLEVLIQQDNLFDAQIQESAALAGRLNAAVMLYKSLGGGW